MKKNNFKTNSKSQAKSQPKQQQGRPQQTSRKPEKSSYNKNWRRITGTHAVMELVNIHPKSIQAVVLQNNWRSSAELRELAEQLEILKIKFDEKPESFLYEISRSHQGAVAFSDLELDFDYTNCGWEETGLVVALDGVEDTQNLGAILRTSWLMGVDGVIIPEDRAVGLTATVHKVACGGAEHVPVHRANQFAGVFEELKKQGFWVFGLSHKAKKTIYDLNIPEKVVWVLGAEDKGLRAPSEKACDELVSIPQLSPNASYNVSVSAALAIGETKRQWMKKK